MIGIGKQLKGQGYWRWRWGGFGWGILEKIEVLRVCAYTGSTLRSWLSELLPTYKPEWEYIRLNFRSLCRLWEDLTQCIPVVKKNSQSWSLKDSWWTYERPHRGGKADIRLSCLSVRNLSAFSSKVNFLDTVRRSHRPKIFRCLCSTKHRLRVRNLNTNCPQSLKNLMVMRTRQSVFRINHCCKCRWILEGS